MQLIRVNHEQYETKIYPKKKVVSDIESIYSSLNLYNSKNIKQLKQYIIHDVQRRFVRLFLFLVIHGSDDITVLEDTKYQTAIDVVVHERLIQYFILLLVKQLL